MTEATYEQHLQSGNTLVAQAQQVATTDFQRARCGRKRASIFSTPTRPT